LEPELPAFNSYMERVSGLMQKGKTYSDVAVYIPFEDGVMKGAYPPERRRVWVWGEYEMRYIFPADELEGHHPLWINRHFLEKANYVNGKLKVGDAQFSTLYIDVNFMDVRALQRILAFAEKGLPICLKKSPIQPGHKKSDEYSDLLNKLKSMPNVSDDFQKVIKHQPLIQGEYIPQYWCKVEEDGAHYLFLAQTHSKDLKYPVYSGQSFMDKSEFRDLTFHVNGKTISKNIEFKPYQSVMVKISPEGELSLVDIDFVPKDPEIRPREKQRMNF